MEYILFLSKKSSNVKTLCRLIDSKHVSKAMAQKIAASGLTYEFLKLAFDRDGPDGINNLLSEKVDGKPRVTANSRVITNICKYFITLW